MTFGERAGATGCLAPRQPHRLRRLEETSRPGYASFRYARYRIFAARRPAGGLINHSDQGVQYASSECVLRLEEAAARISIAAVGNPYENAQVESFFRTPKLEEVYLKDYRSFGEAEENMGRFIEEVYNEKRLHSSLGYLPPVEFEALRALKAGS